MQKIIKDALIVDDHPLALMAIKTLLEKQGIAVVGEAHDGAQAMLLVEKHHPDLVIIDVDIPLMSGIEVVEKLRSLAFTCIIIVVSAKNDLFYGKRSLDAGANAFISKKDGMPNIIAAINATLNGYGYFPLSFNTLTGSLPSEQQMLQSLSSQEIKVMRYILNGTDIMSIASEMYLSNKTISTYKSRLMEKLNCKSLMELFAFAQRNNIG